MKTESSIGERTRVERNLYVCDGIYMVIVRDRAGKQVVQPIGRVNMSKARAERDRIVSEVRDGTTVKTGKDKFVGVALDWLAKERKLRDTERLREASYESYEIAVRCHILPFFTGRAIGSIEPDDIAKWHDWMLTGGERTVVWYDDDGIETRTEKVLFRPQSTWSVRTHFTALNLIFQHARRRKIIRTNPLDALEESERPKPGKSKVIFLDRDEIDALLSKLAEEDRLPVMMAIFLGLRIGELRGLRWMDIDTKANIVYVRGQCDAKGVWSNIPKTAAGHREITLPEFLTDMLREHKMATRHSRPEHYVLASSRGTPLNGKNFAKRRLRPAAEKIGRTDVTFHVLRHTFASILIFQGNDVVYVASQLGHEKPSVTLDVYSHLFGRVKHAERHRAALDQEFGQMFKEKDDNSDEGVVVGL